MPSFLTPSVQVLGQQFLGPDHVYPCCLAPITLSMSEHGGTAEHTRAAMGVRRMEQGEAKSAEKEKTGRGQVTWYSSSLSMSNRVNLNSPFLPSCCSSSDPTTSMPSSTQPPFARYVGLSILSS